MPDLVAGILIGVAVTLAVVGCAIAFVRHHVTPGMQRDLMKMADDIANEMGPGGSPGLTLEGLRKMLAWDDGPYKPWTPPLPPPEPPEERPVDQA